jgi:hypothetical protein
MAKNLNLTFCLLLAFICTCFAQPSNTGNTNRAKVVSTYNSQIGVREKTGHNDGVRVEAYLKYVGLTKGQPWCASFVCRCMGQSGVKNPRAGGCSYLMGRGKIVYISGKVKNGRIPQQADVFFIWFADKKRVAHTGYVDKWSSSWVTTVEGNTNKAGSREGDGVYRKIRLSRQIYAVANYIDK